MTVRNASRPRRSVKDLLIDRLLSLPLSEMDDRISTDSKFHSLNIARRLMERSAAAQPENPAESELLGKAAIQVLERLDPTERIGPYLSLRALCLIANAQRLRGHLVRADANYFMAASLLSGTAETAQFLRGLALLRWEQCRFDEAIGLLTRAERCFRDARLEPEAQATLQLLVLFHAEMGELEDAIAFFNRLEPVAVVRSRRPSSCSRVRPWLSARASLTAAFCLASRTDLASPSQAFEALARGSSLIPFVGDPTEHLQLIWREARARARARMGHSEEAASTLIALRDRFATTAGSLDYLFLTLDLLALQMATRQDAHELLADLEGRSGASPVMTAATESIRLGLRILDWDDPWKSASSMVLILKRAFHKDLPLSPLPFA